MIFSLIIFTEIFLSSYQKLQRTDVQWVLRCLWWKLSSVQAVGRPLLDIRLSELLSKNDWRGNTHRGVQISWMLSSNSCQLLYLHPRKALWLPSRLIVLGLPVGRIERTPSKKEQQTSIQKSIQTSWLYSWLSELKHRVPGAARWKLNKSVRIFRYSTCQIIF